MTCWRVFLPVFLWLVATAVRAAADLAVVTLADTGTLVLRGATWYRLAPGIAIESGDIVAAPARNQVQIELKGGTVVSFAGDGSYLVNTAKDGMVEFALTGGWIKALAKPPGIRVRTAPFEATLTEGIVVLRADGGAAELFVETGGARLAALPPTGAIRAARRGEHWARAGTAPFATRPLAPKAFVEAMPRNYLDPLPVLAPKIRSRPVPVADHDITFAEAEPWLARDRPAFERRFAVRLRDPEFRKAVEPGISRYPYWDRRLHPEKYAPKPTPAPAR